MLACECRLRHVFKGGRRTNGKGGVGWLVGVCGQPGQGRANCFLNSRRQRNLGQPPAQEGALVTQLVGRMVIECSQFGVQPIGPFEEQAVCLGGHDKPRRHGKTCCREGKEVGALAADQGYHARCQLIKIDNKTHDNHPSCKLASSWRIS